MVNSINLDALFADTELPFGHPGRNFDDTPAYSPDFDDRHEPPPVDPPDEDVIHYGPGDRPLCGNESPFAAYTDEPKQVASCQDCMELVAEDPDTHYGGYCLHCRREITAQGGVEWRRAVRRPCPHCGRAGGTRFQHPSGPISRRH